MNEPVQSLDRSCYHREIWWHTKRQWIFGIFLRQQYQQQRCPTNYKCTKINHNQKIDCQKSFNAVTKNYCGSTINHCSVRSGHTAALHVAVLYTALIVFFSTRLSTRLLCTQHLPNNTRKELYLIFRRGSRSVRLSVHFPASKSDSSKQRVRQTNIQLDRRRVLTLQQSGERSSWWPLLCSTANGKFSDNKTTLQTAHRRVDSDVAAPVCCNAT